MSIPTLSRRRRRFPLGLVTGTVEQLTGDPQHQDRILVKVPPRRFQKTAIWARLSSFYASANTGVFFRPEIGDEVVLGFIDNDPRLPIITGVLHHAERPASQVATAENHLKVIETRSKIKIEFNDDERAVKIATPSNNTITLSEDAASIEIKDQHGNQIVMDDNGITIKSARDLRLEAAGQVAIKANEIANDASIAFTAEAGAQATLKAGAQTTIQGAMVLIN